MLPTGKVLLAPLSPARLEDLPGLFAKLPKACVHRDLEIEARIKT